MTLQYLGIYNVFTVGIARSLGLTYLRSDLMLNLLWHIGLATLPFKQISLWHGKCQANHNLFYDTQ